MKKIGILAGAGALAGLSLYSKFLYKLTECGVREDKDFPQIILHNYPFESMSDEGISCLSTAKKEIRMAFEPFKDCEKIIIACNSLHSIVMDDRLINLPLIGIETFKQTASPNEKALIICSSSSKQSKVFGMNRNVSYLSDELSNQSNKVIAKKMGGGYVDEIDYIQSVFKEAKTIGATHIIVGCTELSMLNWDNYKDVGFNILDCMDLAVEEAIEWHKEENYESV